MSEVFGQVQTSDRFSREERKWLKNFERVNDRLIDVKMKCVFDGLGFEVYREEFFVSPDWPWPYCNDSLPRSGADYLGLCACGDSSGYTSRSAVNRWRKNHRQICSAELPEPDDPSSDA